MRKNWLSLMAVAMAVSATGCAGGESKTETTAVVTEAPTTTEAATTTEVATTEEETTVAEFKDYTSAVELRTDYISEDYLNYALAMDKYSDINAVADVMKKAAAGEEITIVTLGGSITQGTISSGSKDKDVVDTVGKSCYADIFFDWWKKAFPKAKINTVNAGIGATGSYIGVHRAAADVITHKPDLVLVEFTVNDAGVKGNQTSYENLVRVLEQSETSPAVMLLMMGMTNGSSAQSTHQEIGLYYNLPMISYAELIRYYMKDGVYTDKELAGDGVHPTVLGHALTGELLWKYLNNVYAHMDVLEPAKKFDSGKEFFTDEKYLKASIVDNDDIEPIDMGTFEVSKKFAAFPNDWSSEKGEGGITFKATFKNLGVLYYCITNGQGAKYDVYVDDKIVATLNSDFTGGWGNYAESAEVFTSNTATEHTVTFRKAADSKGEMFTILGLMVSE